MNSFCVFLVLCFATFTICSPVENAVDVKFFTSKSEIFRKYPNAQPLNSSVKGVDIQYYWGQRVPNDRLVATAFSSNDGPFPQDVTLTVSYPKSGTVGAVVSYFVCQVNQDTEAGQAYVVGGGIGQKNIQVVVQALNTTHFKYDAEIYGN